VRQRPPTGKRLPRLHGSRERGQRFDQDVDVLCAAPSYVQPVS
jgi:hypothetical protein